MGKDSAFEQRIKSQLEIISGGTEEILPLEELKKKLAYALKEKKPLNIKFGVDPTSPDLHLGHAVPLRKLRDFQELGHKVILIIGDFTARIGDPTERVATRPMLTPTEIKENARTYTEQAFKILKKKKTEIVFNSQWFSKMSFEEIIKIASNFTVARLLERDDFYNRYKEGYPISLHEFLYPVMQAYDSFILDADVEIGGTDQKFNMLAGREFQEKMGKEPQVVITLPILEGTDGVQKMSKSLGNHIGLTEPPEEIFGKTMSIPDELMVKYFRLTTNLPKEEVDEIENGLRRGKLHPADAKRRLAREIVKIYYSEEAARKAEEAFNIKHKPGYANDLLKEKVAEVKTLSSKMLRDGHIWIVKLLVELGYAKSNSEARRLVEQKAVALDDLTFSDSEADVKIRDGMLVRVGKRRLAKIKLV